MRIGVYKLFLAGVLAAALSALTAVSAAEIQKLHIGDEWTCSYMKNGVNYQTLKNGIYKKKTNGEISPVLSEERAYHDVNAGMCLGPKVEIKKTVHNNTYSCEYYKQTPDGNYIPLKKGRYIHKLSSFSTQLYDEKVMHDIKNNRCIKQKIKYSDL